MKVTLELNYTNSGIFLNYWDNKHGNDVCAKLLGDGLIDIDGEYTSINEFIERVKKIAEEE